MLQGLIRELKIQLAALSTTDKCQEQDEILGVATVSEMVGVDQVQVELDHALQSERS